MDQNILNLKRSLRQMNISKEIYDPSVDKKLTYIGGVFNANTLALGDGKEDPGGGGGSGGDCDCKELILALQQEIEDLKRRVEILESYHQNKIDVERLKRNVISIQLIPNQYTTAMVKSTLNSLINAINDSILKDISFIGNIPDIYSVSNLLAKYEEIVDFLEENAEIHGLNRISGNYSLNIIKTNINNLLTTLQQ